MTRRTIVLSVIGWFAAVLTLAISSAGFAAWADSMTPEQQPLLRDWVVQGYQWTGGAAIATLFAPLAGFLIFCIALGADQK